MRALHCHLTEGQKTGWYYDQRDNRAFNLPVSPRARAYWTPILIPAARHPGGKSRRERSGVPGFTAPALALAEESARANGVTIKAVKADVFEELERLKAAEKNSTSLLADSPPFVNPKRTWRPGAESLSQAGRLAAEVTAPGGC